MNKNSLSELHWHQTYQHTSEELSLSIISKKGLVKIVESSQHQEKLNSERPILSSFSKKPSQFYYLSSTILRIGSKETNTAEGPIDCSLPVTKKVEKDNKNFKKLKKKILFNSCLNKGIKEFTKPLEFEMKENLLEDNLEAPMDCTLSFVKKEKILCDSSSNNTIKRVAKNSKHSLERDTKKIIEQVVDSQPIVKVERLEKNISNVIIGNSSQKNKSTKDSNSKENVTTVPKEWIKTKDISMEDFVEGADELCIELEDLNKIAANKKAKKRKQ